MKPDTSKLPVKKNAAEATATASAPNPQEANVKVSRGGNQAALLALSTYDDSDAGSDSGPAGLLDYNFENKDDENVASEKAGGGGGKEKIVEDVKIEESKFKHLLEMELLPPEPNGHVDPRIQEAVKSGVDCKDRPTVNESLRSLKAFHNPYILQKVAQEFKIVATGSNYHPDIFDPNAIPPEDNYEVIQKNQKKYEQEKDAKKKSTPSNSASSSRTTSGTSKVQRPRAVPSAVPKMNFSAVGVGLQVPLAPNNFALLALQQQTAMQKRALEHIQELRKRQKTGFN
mmetsp:Transcript_30614/g.74592  ORF Transcript_30614/g.74592 Transcript_30614/m.74592 type:complete len:286 (-) Transcript_30614:165-1022(-)|eukprot:CAMPEP_0114512220 /NCGR_PEP_ID=MMETSP0109-20121206/14848_1 /TAXON_ID=29199 /ORGANISM="Chlorarachnion reptans, Strain CCCM449" /LENGTH=285 /DNA_ID=CAMNT_0001691867 /DNA_START=146 /DNA_END=1003 /DNA_ORIENTATION=+